MAIKPDRSAFISSDHPFVVAIDQRPIADWIQGSAADVAAGSKALIQWRAIHSLRELARVREALGEKPKDSVELTLANQAGDHVTKELRLSNRRPTYGPWPRGTQKVPDGIAYLRIDRMDDEPEFLSRIDRTMAKAKAARGLIVDVRGNGGGTRDALRHLFPYFMTPTDKPRIANVAAYRIPPDEQDKATEYGYLANRFLYPQDAPLWSDAAREVIAKAAPDFKPQWTPSETEFSGWHWMVMERGANPKAYHFDKPVVVLMDTGCFSATDIFLGALKGWRNITLVGTASGGGSARSRRYQLPRSGIQIRLASMASFQPNGQLYDGVGITPDIVVLPNPEDLLGRSDAQLEGALQALR